MWTAELPAPGAIAFGTGCAGTAGVPTFTVAAPQLGHPMQITSSNLPPNAPLWLVQGQSNTSWLGNILPFDLQPFGAPGCMLRVRPDTVREFNANAAGNFTTSMPIAASPALIGQKFFMQLVVTDPGANAWGRTTSRAWQLTIGQ